MVSVLAFYSNDLSSNLAEGYNFSVDIVVEKNENKQKEAVISPLKTSRTSHNEGGKGFRVLHY